MNVRILAVAQDELDDAVAYYDLERPGLGRRFRLEVHRSLNRIAAFPTAYQPISRRMRRCLVPKFPYGIIYHYDHSDRKVLVVAFSHLHRKPNYWLSRRS